MMRKEKSKKNSSGIPILSFFTGGGFLDIGFEQLGFEVVWTNEVDENFAEMYKSGITSWRKAVFSKNAEAKISIVGSIEKIFSPKILSSAFKNKKSSFFGIIGGPPCPDFSIGGKNKGGIGSNGRLSKTFVHRICSIQPDFFVFENVSGLHKTKKHHDFLAKLENILQKKKYCLDLKILNSLEFGVPQDRERLFMIGIKKKVVEACLGRKVKCDERGWFQWPKPKYLGAKNSYSWPDIVPRGKKTAKPSGIPEELTVYSLFKRSNDPSKLPNGNDRFKAYSKKFKIIREGDTRRKSFKRLHRFRFSPTVCYGHNEVHLHPWKKRRLSVREAMRIQGIPDTYVLPAKASLTTKFAVVSNGVPVPLSYAVAKSLRLFFNEGGLIH